MKNSKVSKASENENDYVLKPGEVVLSPEEVENKFKQTKENRAKFEKENEDELDRALNNWGKKNRVQFESFADAEESEIPREFSEIPDNETENEFTEDKIEMGTAGNVAIFG